MEAIRSLPVAVDLESELVAVHDGLIGRLTLVLGDLRSAEDAAQSAFVKAIQRRSRFRRGDLRAWFYTIGIRTALNERRRRERFQPLSSIEHAEWAMALDADRPRATAGERAVAENALADALGRQHCVGASEARGIIVVRLRSKAWNRIAARLSKPMARRKGSRAECPCWPLRSAGFLRSSRRRRMRRVVSYQPGNAPPAVLLWGR